MAVSVITAGIQGPPGPAGNGFTYVHVQDVPLDQWTINHNMRKFPAVFVVEQTATEEIPVRARIDYIDENTLTITFSTAIVGKARLN
jgi:hypothetical protein